MYIAIYIHIYIYIYLYIAIAIYKYTIDSVLNYVLSPIHTTVIGLTCYIIMLHVM